MYARITDIETIRELLGADDETQTMVKTGSVLLVNYTPGASHYLYNLDGTGDQLDTAVKTMLGIVGPMFGKMYMNAETGSIGTHDDWDYELEDGTVVNAVDRGEVVLVEWSEKDEYWVEI